jgi:hypothetical protein
MEEIPKHQFLLLMKPNETSPSEVEMRNFVETNPNKSSQVQPPPAAVVVDSLSSQTLVLE